MHDNLYAYTEVRPETYPGYISINETANDLIEVTVRSPGHLGDRTASLKMTREQLTDMAAKLLAKL